MSLTCFAQLKGYSAAMFGSRSGDGCKKIVLKTPWGKQKYAAACVKKELLETPSEKQKYAAVRCKGIAAYVACVEPIAGVMCHGDTGACLDCAQCECNIDSDKNDSGILEMSA